MDGAQIANLGDQLKAAGDWVMDHADTLAGLGVNVSVGQVSLELDSKTKVLDEDTGDVEDDEQRRARLTGELGILARLLTSVSVEPIRKDSSDYAYSLTAVLAEHYPRVRVVATATADAVCQIVTTDEYVEVTEAVYVPPVMVKKMVRKTEKVCPPSLLAGVEL